MFEILDIMRDNARTAAKAVKNEAVSCWIALSDDAAYTKRELVLGAIACTAVGMVIGMLASPKKKIVIGSNNGCSGCCESDEDEDEEEED